MKTTFVTKFAARTAAIACLLSLSTGTAVAEDSRNNLDQRIKQLANHLEVMQVDETTRIPPAILRRAKGIILLREIRAGLIVGVRAGGGVALVRRGEGSDWSVPAFMRTGEGSAGLQIGGQRQITAILIMNDEGMKVFTEPRFRIGVDAQAVAGPRGVGAEARVQPDVPMLVYGADEGLFAGVTVEGGFLMPDERANRAYYRDADTTMRDILFGDRLEATPSIAEFHQVLARWEAQAGH